MSHSSSLRQLLRVRQLEEEQSRILLEAALGEINRIERALLAAHERERSGSAQVKASICQNTACEDVKISKNRNDSYCISEQGLNRRAALSDTDAARKFIESLKPKLKVVQERVEQLRAAFLSHRVERRQAETLIFEENARHQSEVDRRAQQATDDWYGGRLTREKQASNGTRGNARIRSGENKTEGLVVATLNENQSETNTQEILEAADILFTSFQSTVQKF